MSHMLGTIEGGGPILRMGHPDAVEGVFHFPSTPCVKLHTVVESFQALETTQWRTE